MDNNQALMERKPFEFSCEVVSEKEFLNEYHESTQETIKQTTAENLAQDSAVYPEFDKDCSLSKADKIDYLLAVACGVLSAAIDILWTGKTSLIEAQNWGNDVVGRLVVKAANNRGFSGTDLSKAISFLEQKYPLASDRLTPEFGGGLQHHLRDFSHHASVVGLVFSILSQFTEKGYGTTRQGTFVSYPLPEGTVVGKNIVEKVFFGTVGWAFHLASDMDGTSLNAGRGTGIPGPVVSLLKELSTLPFVRSLAGDNEKGDNKFSVWISKLFNGTEIKGIRFDLRTEIGIELELSKQSIPVIVNECLVRTSYFIKQVISVMRDPSVKTINDLMAIDPKAVLPITLNNRKLSRMLLVSSGTFCAIESSAAFVQSYVNASGFSNGFSSDFFGRINIIGVGRFIVACKTDAHNIIEDLKQPYIDYLKEHNRAIRRVSEVLPVLHALALTTEQKEVLLSLEYTKALLDHDAEKNKSLRIQKEKWITQYYGENKKLVFYQSSSEIRKAIKAVYNNETVYYKELICLELAIFNPFFPLNDVQKKIRSVKKMDTSMLLAGILPQAYPGLLEEIRKAHSEYYSKLLDLRKQKSHAFLKMVASVMMKSVDIYMGNNYAWGYSSFNGGPLSTVSSSLFFDGGLLFSSACKASDMHVLRITTEEQAAFECAKLLSFVKVFLLGKPKEIIAIQSSLLQNINCIEKESSEAESIKPILTVLKRTDEELSSMFHCAS